MAIVGSQPSYTRFSFPIYYSGSDPDTLFAFFSSSRMDPPRYPGSTVTVDSITFIGAVQPFPNGDLENWTSKMSEEPDSWMTINFASPGTGPVCATKATDAYAGSYALRLESILTTWGDTAGYIMQGTFGMNGMMEGGVPADNNPVKISGYYKYIPVGPDTALAGVWEYRYDSSNDSTIIIDSVMIDLPPANSYTYFEMNLSYLDTPLVDTINITFASGNMNDSLSYYGLGSVLHLDDLKIVYEGDAVHDPLFISNHYSVFPNPAYDKISFVPKPKQNMSLRLELSDITGRKLFEGVIKAAAVLHNIDVSTFPQGIYYYRIYAGGIDPMYGKIVITR